MLTEQERQKLAAFLVHINNTMPLTGPDAVQTNHWIVRLTTSATQSATFVHTPKTAQELAGVLAMDSSQEVVDKGVLEFDNGNIRISDAGNAKFVLYENYVTVEPLEERSGCVYKFIIDKSDMAAIFAWFFRSQQQPVMVQRGAFEKWLGQMFDRTAAKRMTETLIASGTLAPVPTREQVDDALDKAEQTINGSYSGASIARGNRTNAQIRSDAIMSLLK